MQCLVPPLCSLFPPPTRILWPFSFCISYHNAALTMNFDICVENNHYSLLSTFGMLNSPLSAVLQRKSAERSRRPPALASRRATLDLSASSESLSSSASGGVNSFLLTQRHSPREPPHPIIGVYLSQTNTSMLALNGTQVIIAS